MTALATKEQMLNWQLFTTPPAAWDAMYADCQAARESIYFEQYIFEYDEQGIRFMELLIEKARAGLNVFLICDAFGSESLYKSDLPDKLRRHGGHIHFYNAIHGIKLFMPWRWFPRTHMKILLVDSTIAYTGGVGIASYMECWRDTHIRLTGPVAEQVRHDFERMKEKIMRLKRNKTPVPLPNAQFSYWVNRPRKIRRAIYHELLQAIDNAKDYIYITSAYFIPNRRFLAHLKMAHDRGVDVQVIVPQCSDVYMADWIGLSYVRRYLATGMRLFHYHNCILHSKTAIIDGNWATVGSTNFDVISFFHNREANVTTHDSEVVAELKAHFHADLKHSTEMTKEAWSKVPLWKKMVGVMLRALRVFF